MKILDKFLVGILCLFLSLSDASAQFFNAVAISGNPSYIGLGDIQSSAYTYCGTFSYSLANVQTKAIQVTRASDSATQDIYTLANGFLNIQALATFLAGTTGVVSKCYDGTGNSRNWAPSTSIDSPSILWNSSSCSQQSQYIACICFTPALSNQNLQLTISNANAPFTYTAIYNSTQSIGVNYLLQSGTGTDPGIMYNYPPGGNLYLQSNGSFNVTAADSTWHTLEAVFNGSSSFADIDSVHNTGSLGSGTTTGTTIQIGSSINYTLNGCIEEFALYETNVSSLKFHANQCARAGTSC